MFLLHLLFLLLILFIYISPPPKKNPPGSPRPLPSLPHLFSSFSTFNWRPHSAPAYQCNKGDDDVAIHDDGDDDGKEYDDDQRCAHICHIQLEASLCPSLSKQQRWQCNVETCESYKSCNVGIHCITRYHPISSLGISHHIDHHDQHQHHQHGHQVGGEELLPLHHHHQHHQHQHHHHHHQHHPKNYQYGHQVGGDGGLPLHHHVNGGGPRKYQCKMCPQVGLESSSL